MPATLFGDTDLVFGVPVVTGVYMQTAKGRRMGQYAVAGNEENDAVGIATHRTNMGEIDGTYLFKGADIVAAIGDTIASELNDLGFGTVIVYEFGRERVNNDYAKGDFKAVGVDFPV